MVFLAGLMTVFGVPPRWTLPLAVGVTIAVHYVFYSWLRVPLPWGVLEGMAW
jgi:putative tricarboxylic transport membrane protein